MGERGQHRPKRKAPSPGGGRGLRPLWGLDRVAGGQSLAAGNEALCAGFRNRSESQRRRIAAGRARQASPAEDLMR
jgi:hypothetical protein